MTACMVGWSHTKFGKLDGEDVESLMARVAAEAIADAGIEPKDVDAVIVGQFNAGFTRQEFPASLVFQTLPELRFKPATRVENACATGSAAIFSGIDAIAARRARIVLVVGVEKMTELSGPAVGEALMKASYLKEEGGIGDGLPVCSTVSRSSIFSATAINPTHWPASRRRTTRTGHRIRWRKSKRILDSNSVAIFPIRTRSFRGY